ncbi:MAG: DEAD/DEAH box helicase, partial [Leptospirales bacterium]|nr:DEAD/DEAH box helicase [Leptospirales bacterium]
MLYRPVTNINGIGPKKSAILKEEAGIENIEDLLYYVPRAYIDRSSFKRIADCLINENVSVRGEIKRLNVAAWPRKRLEVEIDDGSDTLTGIFFAGIPHFLKIFHLGEEIIFAGKINFFKQKQIIHPEYDFLGDVLNTSRIVPLYKSTEKLKNAGFDSRGFRRIVKSVLNNIENMHDSIAPIAAKYALPALKDALNQIHFPETFEHAENARRRLAFNEIFFLLFYISLSKTYMRQNFDEGSGNYSDDLCRSFIKSLPFMLTEGQKNAIDEIIADMTSPFPMNRLLQGDVGSGKTVVALATAMLPVSAGRQIAFMAPTEVLAKQHFETIKTLLPPAIKGVLLTGSSSSAERNEALN